MGKLSEVAIQARAPARLGEALEREAERRMMTKSALVRWMLAEALEFDATAEETAQTLEGERAGEGNVAGRAPARG